MKMYRIPKVSEIDLDTISLGSISAYVAESPMPEKTKTTIEFFMVASGFSKRPVLGHDVAGLSHAGNIRETRKTMQGLLAFAGQEFPVDMLALAGAPKHTIEGGIWMASIRNPSRFTEVLRLMARERPHIKKALAETALHLGFDLETRSAIGMAVA